MGKVSGEKLLRAQATTFVFNYGHVSTLPILDSTLMAPPWGANSQAHPKVKPEGLHERSLTLGHVKEFAHAARAFAPLAPPLASLEMVNTLLTLHPPNIDYMCLDSLFDF